MAAEYGNGISGSQMVLVTSSGIGGEEAQDQPAFCMLWRVVECLRWAEFGWVGQVDLRSLCLIIDNA